jgi:hypothetical protein
VPSVTEIIAAYTAAREQHDWANAMQALASLESEDYNNQPDWEQILSFCKQHNFNARIEIITRRLINGGQLSSYKPYFVLTDLLLKSGFKEKARALLDEYAHLTGKMPPHQGEYVRLLYAVEDYTGCLREAQKFLKTTTDPFPFLVAECTSLWRLNQLKVAKQKLKALSLVAFEDPARLVWCAYVALEQGERDLFEACLINMIERISTGSIKLAEGAVFLLRKYGYLEQVRNLVRDAQPQHYETVAELTYVFELAKNQGAYNTTVRFGQAILAAEPDHALKQQIENLMTGRGFLMA